MLVGGAALAFGEGRSLRFESLAKPSHRAPLYFWWAKKSTDEPPSSVCVLYEPFGF